MSNCISSSHANKVCRREHGESIKITLEKKYRNDDPGIHLHRKHGRVHVKGVGGTFRKKFQDTRLTINKSGNSDDNYKEIGPPIRARDQLTFVGGQHVSEFDSVADIHDLLQEKLLINLTFVAVDSDESSDSTDSDLSSFDDESDDESEEEEDDDDYDDNPRRYNTGPPQQPQRPISESRRTTREYDDDESIDEEESSVDDDDDDDRRQLPAPSQAFPLPDNIKEEEDDDDDDDDTDTDIENQNPPPTNDGGNKVGGGGCHPAEYIWLLCMCVALLLVINVIFLIIYLKD